MFSLRCFFSSLVSFAGRSLRFIGGLVPGLPAYLSSEWSYAQVRVTLGDTAVNLSAVSMIRMGIARPLGVVAISSIASVTQYDCGIRMVVGAVGITSIVVVVIVTDVSSVVSIVVAASISAVSPVFEQYRKYRQYLQYSQYRQHHPYRQYLQFH